MTALTVIKTLKKPWRVAQQDVTEVEVREATVKDLTAAELEANPALTPNAFNVALACQTVVRAGNFTGPFSPGMFATMSSTQWAEIRNAMSEAERLGEA